MDEVGEQEFRDMRSGLVEELAALGRDLKEVRYEIEEALQTKKSS